MSGSETMVGAVLNGRWSLTKLLGEGGMGAVFAAEGLQGQGARAIKILHPEFVNEPQILDRFLKEGFAAQQLNHPNVARIFEHAQAEDGTPYLVMELLQGIPLAEYVQPGKPVPPASAAPIIYGVLQALAAAHSQNIVHRDLKPDNIFLVPDQAGRYTVKVLDFGIAKVMDAAGGMGSKTRTGVLLGTPGYMSPEQIKNAKAVDPRSDLWSVGIIFYEMLTGREAFDATTDFARLTAVLTQEPKPIGVVAPQLAIWQDFFTRAIARDVAKRFSTADEMAQVLVATARGQAGAGALPTAQFQSVAVQQHVAAVSSSAATVPRGDASTYVSPRSAEKIASQPPAAPPVKILSTPPPGSMRLDETLKSGPGSVLGARATDTQAARSGVSPLGVVLIAFICFLIGAGAGFASAYILFAK